MIYAQSRYEYSDLIFAVDGEGTSRRIVRAPTPRDRVFEASRHVVHEGDRLDLLAARYYNDPEMWWVIADANPEVFYPGDIAPGTVVRIPHAPTLL